MSTLTTLTTLPPELLIQIFQSLSFDALISLHYTSAYLHNVITHHQFTICESICANELDRPLAFHFTTLLRAHGDAQRLVSNLPAPVLTTTAMRSTGVLSGGNRIGIDEAIQIANYLR